MEKIVEQGILYDFYGPLLTEHQQRIFEAFVFDNMSLGEIAEEQGVSRQAVHDIVKRCDAILNNYESKLGLISRFASGKKHLNELKDLSSKAPVDIQVKMNDIIDVLIEEW